jgi:hypothetical protein
MPAPLLSRDELWAIAHEHHHVQEALAGTTSASVRRKLQARFAALQERFERELQEAVPDEQVRRAWRQHVSHGAPAPDEPRPLSPLVFRGRSEVGSEVVVREGSDGELVIEVDGAIYDRRPGLDLILDAHGALLRVGALPPFRETFNLPTEAREGLAAWLARPGSEPPWRWARELIAEGLVDRVFALTPRGRRALKLIERSSGGP